MLLLRFARRPASLARRRALRALARHASPVALATRLTIANACDAFAAAECRQVLPVDAFTPTAPGAMPSSEAIVALIVSRSGSIFGACALIVSPTLFTA